MGVGLAGFIVAFNCVSGMGVVGVIGLLGDRVSSRVLSCVSSDHYGCGC